MVPETPSLSETPDGSSKNSTTICRAWSRTSNASAVLSGSWLAITTAWNRRSMCFFDLDIDNPGGYAQPSKLKNPTRDRIGAQQA